MVSKDRQKYPYWRIHFLMLVVFLTSLAIIIRLFSLQVLKYDIYDALASGQHNYSETLTAERGEIFIEDPYSGELYPLAINRQLPMVFAVPRQITDVEEAVEKLSPLLEMSEEELREKLSKEDDPYEPLKHRLSEETAKEIETLDLEGIELRQENWRYYTQENLAAHVLGFVGFDEDEKEGQYGVEGYYNEILEGEQGFLEAARDSLGRWISFGSRDVEPAKDGDDLVLTLDQTIQFMAEEKLKELVNKWGAEGGSVIIMEPATGAIKAMGSYPNFNPNQYFEEKNLDVFLNPVTQKVFEPGSAFKPITMAGALDKEKVGPQTTYIDEGTLMIDGWPISNYDGKAHGLQTMTEVLEKSLNTGAIFAGEQLGKKYFAKYVKNFGFDAPTGIGLEGERKGDLSNLETKSDVNYATASFGQGIAVTPLQLITAISAIANNGRLMQPYIVDRFIHNDGSITKTEPQVVREVISPQAASKLTAMLVSVIRNGQVKRAGVEGYQVAGKTGTAQVPNLDKKGYSDKTIHCLVGFAPAFDPKFAILIKIDDPKGIRFAADSISPTFSQLTKFLLDYYQIPPSE